LTKRWSTDSGPAAGTRAARLSRASLSRAKPQLERAAFLSFCVLSGMPPKMYARRNVAAHGLETRKPCRHRPHAEHARNQPRRRIWPRPPTGRGTRGVCTHRNAARGAWVVPAGCTGCPPPTVVLGIAAALRRGGKSLVMGVGVYGSRSDASALPSRARGPGPMSDERSGGVVTCCKGGERSAASGASPPQPPWGGDERKLVGARLPRTKPSQPPRGATKRSRGGGRHFSHELFFLPTGNAKPQACMSRGAGARCPAAPAVAA